MFWPVESKVLSRIFHHWEKWECVSEGMYSTDLPSGVTPERARLMYCEFLSDIPRFNQAMARVVAEWPISCEQFLSNNNINRIAWLGQSSACIDMNIPCWYRGGFQLLSDKQQAEANEAARTTLVKWLSKRNDVLALSMDEVEQENNGHAVRGVRRLISHYIEKWNRMGYPIDIPDEVPAGLMQLNLAPSYKAIAIAILKNDLHFTSLGYGVSDSKWYSIIKKEEIRLRPKLEHEQRQYEFNMETL